MKSRLILYSISITLLVLASLLGISFVTLRLFLRANLVETTSYKLRIAMDYIDHEVDRLVQLVNWCSVTTDVVAFVDSPPRFPADRKFKALAAHRLVRDSVYANGLDGYVDKLVIGGFEGHSLQVGLLQGDYRDFRIAMEMYEKMEGRGRSAPAWNGLVPSLFPFSGKNLAIPLAMGIRSDDARNVPVGFVFAAINTEVVSRFLSGFDLETGARLFIGIGDSDYEIVDRKTLSPSASRIADMGGDIVACHGRTTGWTLAQTLPMVQLTRQNQVFAWLLAITVGFIALLVFLLLVTVDRTLNQPIDRINRRVALVSKGDFSHDPDIEWDDELGNIGRAVNGMSRDIEELIERRLEDEKSQKKLEFRMLQNQINPHFLYNTLSAIKWMAEIQKAPGIAEMVNALATLLRHAARDSGALVPLERELELVNEYCVIQRYRSANLFELEVAVRDEALRRCKVVKFMLQPIVENAIMHGIEPKMAPGRIRIEASRDGDGFMRVEVADDGVGIAPERIPGLLTAESQDCEAFNHIGLFNVHERLVLAFGEGAGLSIDSRLGEYTKVSVRLPCVLEGDEAAPGGTAPGGTAPMEAACTR